MSLSSLPEVIGRGSVASNIWLNSSWINSTTPTKLETDVPKNASRKSMTAMGNSSSPPLKPSASPRHLVRSGPAVTPLGDITPSDSHEQGTKTEIKSAEDEMQARRIGAPRDVRDLAKSLPVWDKDCIADPVWYRLQRFLVMADDQAEAVYLGLFINRLIQGLLIPFWSCFTSVCAMVAAIIGSQLEIGPCCSSR